jgi:hypothetical protein
LEEQKTEENLISRRDAEKRREESPLVFKIKNTFFIIFLCGSAGSSDPEPVEGERA